MLYRRLLLYNSAGSVKLHSRISVSKSPHIWFFKHGTVNLVKKIFKNLSLITHAMLLFTGELQMSWKNCEKEKKKQYTRIFRRVRPLFLPQEQLYQVHTHPRRSEPPEHFEASLDTSQAVSATRSSCRETLLVIKVQNSSYSLLVYTTHILLRIKLSFGRWTIFM